MRPFYQIAINGYLIIYDKKSAMTPRQIELRIKRIKRDLMKLGPMRPGALSMQYAACQKPGCACVDPVKPKKHGPFYQLGYSHVGTSTTRFSATVTALTARSPFSTSSTKSG